MRRSKCCRYVLVSDSVVRSTGGVDWLGLGCAGALAVWLVAKEKEQVSVALRTWDQVDEQRCRIRR
jgi:hypothetical protein